MSLIDLLSDELLRDSIFLNCCCELEWLGLRISCRTANAWKPAISDRFCLHCAQKAQITVIIGPRKIGKSTVAAQLAQWRKPDEQVIRALSLGFQRIHLHNALIILDEPYTKDVVLALDSLKRGCRLVVVVPYERDTYPWNLPAHCTIDLCSSSWRGGHSWPVRSWQRYDASKWFFKRDISPNLYSPS